MLPEGLIVSCQALEDEPLHSSYIMSKMAKAAKEGGARAIRANSCEDIEAIWEETQLPIIGIIKKDYPDSEVYITATMKEVDALAKTPLAVIALDATANMRPQGEDLKSLYNKIRRTYPDIKLMADCSTEEEAYEADKMGFDYIGTTLVGYTKQSSNLKIEDNDFEIIRNLVKKCKSPIVAEGNIDTPQKARRVLELGCHSVVVGSIITRPQLITQRFTNEIKNGGEN